MKRLHALSRSTPTRGPARSLALLCALALAACGDDAAPADAAPADAGPDASGADADGGCGVELGPLPTIKEPTLYAPRWVFEPWISKDISSTKDTYDFVDGFAKHDIPVGAVVLDSPWETNYNTFVPSPSRYPDFKQLVADLHAREVRVVLWITQMINKASFDLEQGGDSYPGPSPNFDEARRCGFFVNGGKTYLWWKGAGAGLDFFNARAVAWWHRQQDQVLEAGIDGWKLDFGESYISTAEVTTAQGKVKHQAYSEAYYRDFYAYGVHKRGKQFVTMVRGYDKSYQFEGRFFARPEHAPVVWAGDNRRDWLGLADALDHIFRSAAAGYVVVGSDIGGYLDLDDKTHKAVPFDQDAFVRWVAVGALCPFMQLHGRQNLTPWTVTPKTTETLAIYRYWSWLHHELVPFFYSLGRQAHAGGGAGVKAGILRPVGQPQDWPGDYRYQLGEALLVAPLLDGSGKRDVALPAGHRWYDWWQPAAAPHDGGATLAAYDATDQQRIPLFVREGAIIPAEVENDLTGLGSQASRGALTVLIYPGPASSSFTLHEQDDKTTTIGAARDTDGKTSVTLSRLRRPTILRLRAEVAPAQVALGGAALTARAGRSAWEQASAGWFYDAATRALWVKLAAAAAGASLTVQ